MPPVCSHLPHTSHLHTHLGRIHLLQECAHVRMSVNTDHSDSCTPQASLKEEQDKHSATHKRVKALEVKMRALTTELKATSKKLTQAAELTPSKKPSSLLLPSSSMARTHSRISMTSGNTVPDDAESVTSSSTLAQTLPLNAMQVCVSLCV